MNLTGPQTYHHQQKLTSVGLSVCQHIRTKFKSKGATD